MATIAEMIAQMRDPGENGIPDTIYDDLTQSYTDESSGWLAKTTEYDEKAKAQESEISRLKSLLFDMTLGAPAPAENVSDDSEDEDDSDEDETEEIGFDALFKPKE